MLKETNNLPLNNILKQCNIRWETSADEDLELNRLEETNTQLYITKQKIIKNKKELNKLARNKGYRNYSHMEYEMIKRARKYDNN